MKTIVLQKDVVNLEESLLNEIDGIELKGIVEVEGVVVLNDEFKVLPMVSDFLDSEFQSRQISPKSASVYGKNISYCLDYLLGKDEFKGFMLDEPFLSVSRATLLGCFIEIRNSGLDGATIRNRDASLKSFFEKYLCSEYNPLRNDNPYKLGLISASVKGKIKIGCELEEVKSLMLSTDLERERLLIQFIFDTGVRRSEVGRVTLADIRKAIEFDKSKLYSKDKEINASGMGYYPLKISGSKGRNQQIKERITLISAATLRRINQYHSSPLYKKNQRKYKTPQETPAFFNSRGQPISEFNIDSIVAKTSKKAFFRGQILKKISPHILRHGYAYEILKSPDFGNDYLDKLVHVQKTLGHSDLSTTQTYTKIPIELFNLIVDKDGAVLTKSQKMEKLTRDTKLSIKIGDKK